MDNAENSKKLTDAVRASVTHSGVLSNLRQVKHEDAPHDDLAKLTEQANTAIENIEHLLNAGKLDDTTSLKLTAALTKLRSAVGKDNVSRAALTQALAEASTAVSGTDCTGKAQTLQEKTDQLWHRIKTSNKEIDDDFTKMQKAGIVFNQTLLNRHTELMEYLKTHPRDLTSQKELDAVDDAMLLQAEKQLKEHPNAQPSFDDANKKSKDRHEMVDKELAVISKRESVADNALSAFDDTSSPDTKLTMNDVAPPTGLPSEAKNNSQKFVRKHTNVYFRTKSNRKPTLYLIRSPRNFLLYSANCNSHQPRFRESNGKFCSKIYVGLLHNRCV
ncbi:hypothetical protein [Mucilaginibacter sp. HD30]